METGHLSAGSDPVYVSVLWHVTAASESLPTGALNTGFPPGFDLSVVRRFYFCFRRQLAGMSKRSVEPPNAAQDGS